VQKGTQNRPKIGCISWKSHSITTDFPLRQRWRTFGTYLPVKFGMSNSRNLSFPKRRPRRYVRSSLSGSSWNRKSGPVDVEPS
jgi:hypothetical protein